MKTKTTRAFTLAAALLAISTSINAQNTTADADLITPTIGGGFNAVFGLNSMLSNTGLQNSALGWGALSNNPGGNANSAGGYAALYNNQGDGNTGFGAKALDGNSSGKNNSGCGLKALTTNQIGDFNSALGFYADVSANGLSFAAAIGANAVVNASNRIWLGDAATDVWCQAAAWNTSDQRFKFSVSADDVKGIDFIKLLRPVVYNFDTKKLTEFMTKNMSEESRNKHLERDFSKSTAIRQTGFLAQEVEEAAKKSGYNFSGVHVPEGDNDTYGLSYAQFVVPLVKAVQEQQQMIDDQKALNQQLLQHLADQQKAIDALTTAAKTQGATGIGSQSGMSSFAMEQNEPNPFTHETLVKYNLPEQASNAYMAVYDLSGKQITTFALTQKGNGSLTITSEKLSAGIYIYSIVSDGKVFDSKKMIVADK